ncbi:hypothetical protein [Sporocytophaga myxococcoides]|uniref:hypothetical protein n=1 Tax=Sporocytophaga myxococcoides TaxID=153721 RepID=UPI00048B5F7C|nr:hypothetical protein [Sporocytophaga myxococcoides]
MNFLNRFFNRGESQIECPRCLGKGHVDWADIKRLNQVLKWIPGSCAFCNGVGKIDPKMEKKVAVDATYLVDNLSEIERRLYINGNPEALERAAQYESNLESFVEQVNYLHFHGKLSSEQITEFFLLSQINSDSYDDEKAKLTDYINRIIARGESK